MLSRLLMAWASKGTDPEQVIPDYWKEYDREYRTAQDKMSKILSMKGVVKSDQPAEISPLVLEAMEHYDW